MTVLIKACMPLGLYRWLYRRRHGIDPKEYAAEVARDVRLPEIDIGELANGKLPQEILLPGGISRTGSSMRLPAEEAARLALLCRLRAPEKIFEIGTFTGFTALIMAMNTPPGTRIFSLDVNTTARNADLTGSVDYLEESLSKQWRDKITLLQGDSTAYDFSPYAGAMDLVFVDANHTYPFASRDSRTALRLLRPGAMIIWDDYLWQAAHPECIGVMQSLHEISPEYPCYRLSGSRMAIFQERVAPRL